MAVGVAVGLAYALIDRVLDTMLGAGTLTGTLELVHTLVVSLGLPVVTGACLGLTTFWWRERAKAALQQQLRADGLRSKLERVERNQAVWVMAAAVLHEVRNPLHALGLLLDELALESAPSPLLDHARAHVDRIGRHVQTLRDLPHAGSPEASRVDLAQLAAGILADRAELLAAEHIQARLQVVEPSMALADPIHVRIIVENLIDNGIAALKQVNTTRSLSLVIDHDSHRTRLRVCDSGPGLPADAEQLFEPLRSTRERGLGLGLPIARALARAMDGEVAFDEGAEQTVFFVRLPRAVQA